MELSEFLLARIAEDKARALAVQRQHGGRKWTSSLDARGEGWVTYDYGPGLLVTMDSVGESARILVDHVIDWNPNRVLAECEAKRALVAYCARAQDAAEVARSYAPAERELAAMLAPVIDKLTNEALAPVLQYLALPYADHADYREEWKP